MEYPEPLGGGYKNIRYVYVFSNGKLDRDPRLGVPQNPTALILRIKI